MIWLVLGEGEGWSDYSSDTETDKRLHFFCTLNLNKIKIRFPSFYIRTTTDIDFSSGYTKVLEYLHRVRIVIC